MSLYSFYYRRLFKFIVLLYERDEVLFIYMQQEDLVALLIF